MKFPKIYLILELQQDLIEESEIVRKQCAQQQLSHTKLSTIREVKHKF
jgi:hypothetical protein